VRILVSLCAVVGLWGQDLPTAAPELGAFAFADAGGTRLLSTGNPQNPEALHVAICEGTGPLRVTFVGHQEQGEKDTGRQIAANFENTPGDVYKLVRGQVAKQTNCFLATDGFVASGSMRAVMRPTKPQPCDREVRTKIAQERQRAAANCWTIGRDIWLVEFVRQDKDMLAGLFVKDGAHMFVVDYPGTFEAEGGSVWRVDDGGVLSPEAIHVVFLQRRGAGYLMGAAWWGAEGNSIEVLEANSGDRFTPLLRDYWYWAPM
jgi:hypothetical protein